MCYMIYATNGKDETFRRNFLFAFVIVSSNNIYISCRLIGTQKKKKHLFQHCWSNSYDLCVTSGISGNIPRVHRNHLAAATQTNQTLFFLSFLFFLLIFFLFSFFPPLVLFSPPTRFFLAHCHFRMNTKMYTKRA